MPDLSDQNGTAVPPVTESPVDKLEPGWSKAITAANMQRNFEKIAPALTPIAVKTRQKPMLKKT